MLTNFKKHASGHLLLAACLLGWGICLAVASARLRGLLINSCLLAGGTLLISIPVGTFLAVAIAKTSLWGRRQLEHGLIALLFIPLYVQAAAWQATAGQSGWLTNNIWLTGWRGAIWIHGVAAIPWVVLFVAAALRKVPREFEEEALQDASTWRVLLWVTLQRAAAGIVAAALWVTVICFSEITVTDLFQVRTFAEEIYTAASLGTLNGAALPPTTPAIDSAVVPQFAAGELWLGTITMVLLVLAALAATWLWVPVTDFVSPATSWKWPLSRGRRGLAFVAWLLVAIVIGAPLIGLIGKAGARVTRSDGEVVREWSVAKAATLIARSPWEHRREFGWSLVIGSVATVAATTTGVLVAWGLRSGQLPKLPTALLLSLGFAIPGPLLGVWLIRCLNQPPDSMFAALTWSYDHTILAPVLAQFLRSLPLATLIVAAQFASLPQDVLDSARCEGAGWWRQLFSVAVPWCWPAIAAATCMALIVSVGDLAATLLVVPPGVSPLSVRIFGLLHYGAEDRVSALSLMLALLLCLAATLAWQLQQHFSRRQNREA